jgi:hypothetical protein
LFTVENGVVKVDNRLAGLLEKGRQQPHDMDEGTKFRATITISNADISTVQSFLWSLSHHMNQLDSGFTIDDNRAAKGTIQVNQADALLGMIRAAFTIIENDPDKRTENIRRYVLVWLPEHLKDIRNHSLSEQEVKEIKQGLTGLFWTAHLWERHWTTDLAEYLAESWKRDDVVTMREWLTDPIAKDKWYRPEQRWIKEIEDNKYPDFHLLRSIALMVARDWLQDEKWDASSCWKWLRFALSMVRVGH